MRHDRHRIFGFKDLTKTYFERPGVYVVLESEDHCIGVAKTPKGCFLIGGGIEQNEDHLACLRRECLEETGYDLEIFHALGSADIYGYHEKLGPFHPVQYYYSGRLLGQRQEPQETDHQLVWIPYPEVLTKMYVEAQAWAIACLKDEIGGNK